MLNPVSLSLSLATGFVIISGGAAADAATCESLSALSIANTTVTLAQTVAAGAFTPPARGGGPGGPAGAGRGPQFTDLPAFCRVQATLKPISDSDIRMELWLPAASNWNSKFRGTGNGGLGGGAGVNVNALATGVRAGYAAAGHNTGHEGDSSYALDHPEQIKDFGYRSTSWCRAWVTAPAQPGPKTSTSTRSPSSNGGKRTAEHQTSSSFRTSRTG
jgi:feruloyl esterase